MYHQDCCPRLNKRSKSSSVPLQSLLFLENFCQLPPDPIQGHKLCSESADRVSCAFSCQSGFAFAIDPEDDYFCNKFNQFGQVWHPVEKEASFPPDCSVTRHSQLLVTPTSLEFGLLHSPDAEANAENDEYGSVCDDQFFLNQVTPLF